MPAGRPTDYTPERCAEIIEWMEQGYSLTAAAGKMGVAKQTVYNWAEMHPEFLDALNEARAKTAAWWEDRAIEIARGIGDGNPTMVIFGLKNRVADEWRDKRDVDMTSSDGSLAPTRIIIQAADDQRGD